MLENVDDPGMVDMSSFKKRSRGRPTKSSAEKLAKATRALTATKSKTRERDAVEIEQDYRAEQERQERMQTWLNTDQVCVDE